MKFNQKQYLMNLVECAKEVYLGTYRAARESDFAVHNLDNLNKRCFLVYNSKKKAKRKFEILTYISAELFNHEIITDRTLQYEISILVMISKLRLYRAHKFIQFAENHEYLRCLLPGVKYDEIHLLIEKLKRGVLC